MWPRRGAAEVFGQTSAMRTVGVEEELLLVDVHTGKPRSVASQVIAADGRRQRGVELATAASRPSSSAT